MPPVVWPRGISVLTVVVRSPPKIAISCKSAGTLRLDQAAHLLRRRESLGISQPLSEIAHASGFRDYTHFARKFRRRLGTRQAPTQKNLVTLTTEQCAPTLVKVRHGLTRRNVRDHDGQQIAYVYFEERAGPADRGLNFTAQYQHDAPNYSCSSNSPGPRHSKRCDRCGDRRKSWWQGR
jgi:hypothetical protein